MTQHNDQVTLTEPQQAAIAKLACGLESPGGIALLCGPPGAGKTMVLERLALVTGCTSGVQRFADCEARIHAAAGDEPAVLFIDDAHEADDGGLNRLVTACRRRRPDVRVVLAGTGRLLTLVARDPRIERGIRLRATLRPCTAVESATLVAEVLGAGRGGLQMAPPPTDVVQTIHEIAAGIPALVVRLAGLARIITEMHPEQPLTVADVELVHRRLSLQAA